MIGQITLSEREVDASVALFAPYLDDYPRRQARPLTYRAAAELLGEPWTDVKVRKQVARVKDRLLHMGVSFDGSQAKYDLADFLIRCGLLSPADLRRLRGRP